ncbi:hypothetical protein Cpin_5132 [Chitinophaga pinensis DSM 2588]|uniref:Uncharacterized protein n=1 Tax=Chitinophaga pinensis (strain ATCC 43595 / DSM 2588 / LMG 13176 / NBRC 15968 / NCIMB 11800 / UQM 2034) TaxID=485918 RepID=A0A979G7Y9_CHIPD|nr:hypothetical protein Cpin_5132 [Chitinophaga pinensis DSM 2588]
MTSSCPAAIQALASLEPIFPVFKIPIFILFLYFVLISVKSHLIYLLTKFSICPRVDFAILRYYIAVFGFDAATAIILTERS